MPVDFDRVRALRTAAGLSIAAAAARAGMAHKQQWHEVESGCRTSPRFDTVTRMAHAVGARVADILTDRPPGSPTRPPAGKPETLDLAKMRALRISRGQIAEVAAATGMTMGNYSNIESGRRGATIATLERIAAALGVSLRDLSTD